MTAGTRAHRGESGQATIEFALTLILLLGFVFFYLQLGLVMAVGNYFQYASFMSARAYLAAGPDEGDQLTRATAVLTSMVKSGEGSETDRWPTLARGDEGDQVKGATIGRGSLFQEKNKDFSWMEGVRYSFRSRLFILPIGGGGDTPGPFRLATEAWLGREPTFSECRTYMSTVSGEIDNGC